MRRNQILILLSLSPLLIYSWQVTSNVDFVPLRKVSKRPFTQTPLEVASIDITPEVNPAAHVEAKSLSGIRYESVASGLERLYPSDALHMRNAASRTDGYWAYISRGEEPPMDTTYGEFDLHFFAELIDRAHHHYYHNHDESKPPSSWDGKVFADLGSGTGRLVLGAAALHPGWKECRGIELLEGIHNVAVEKVEKCIVKQDPPTDSSSKYSLVLPYSCPVTRNQDLQLGMAPVDIKCGSFDDPYEYLGDIDCAFVFSSCFSSDLLERLGRAIGRQFRPGSIIITTDYMLPLENTIPPVEGDDTVASGTYKLELVEKVDGWCWLTGGDSTAYIHRVVKSLS